MCVGTQREVHRMPRRMTYEELMEHPVTQKILGKYVEEGTDIIRRNVLKQGMHDETLRRRLKRLCEEGILLKVDRNRRPTKGGGRAPETYYVLHGEHWRAAIKSADINRLREQDLKKMTSGMLTTVYGLDVSDFEENEEERKAFIEVLTKMESLSLALLHMKARIAQRRLGEALAELKIEDVNPLTRYIIEYFAWINLVAPLVDIKRMTLEEYLRKAMSAIPLMYEMENKLNDEETEELVRSVLRSTRYIYQHRDEYENIIQDQATDNLRGMVVAHVTPSPGRLEASYERTQDRFSQFLKWEEEWDEVEGPFFEWLKKYVPTAEDLRSSVVPFRATFFKYFKTTPDELETHLQRMKEETDLPFLVKAFQTGFLSPPRAPSLDDVRDSWKSEGEKET